MLLHLLNSGSVGGAGTPPRLPTDLQRDIKALRGKVTGKPAKTGEGATPKANTTATDQHGAFIDRGERRVKMAPTMSMQNISSAIRWVDIAISTARDPNFSVVNIPDEDLQHIQAAREEANKAFPGIGDAVKQLTLAIQSRNPEAQSKARADVAHCVMTGLSQLGVSENTSQLKEAVDGLITTLSKNTVSSFNAVKPRPLSEIEGRSKPSALEAAIGGFINRLLLGVFEIIFFLPNVFAKATAPKAAQSHEANPAPQGISTSDTNKPSLDTARENREAMAFFFVENGSLKDKIALPTLKAAIATAEQGLPMLKTLLENAYDTETGTLKTDEASAQSRSILEYFLTDKSIPTTTAPLNNLSDSERKKLGDLQYARDSLAYLKPEGSALYSDVTPERLQTITTVFPELKGFLGNIYNLQTGRINSGIDILDKQLVDQMNLVIERFSVEK